MYEGLDLTSVNTGELCDIPFRSLLSLSHEVRMGTQIRKRDHRVLNGVVVESVTVVKLNAALKGEGGTSWSAPFLLLKKESA